MFTSELIREQASVSLFVAQSWLLVRFLIDSIERIERMIKCMIKRMIGCINERMIERMIARCTGILTECL
jgi:hypothetical protein